VAPFCELRGKGSCGVFVVVCLQVKPCDPHLSALEVRLSRRGAIQIYVYLYLYLYLCSVKTVWSMNERFRGEFLTMGRCINLSLPLPNTCVIMTWDDVDVTTGDCVIPTYCCWWPSATRTRWMTWCSSTTELTSALCTPTSTRRSN